MFLGQKETWVRLNRNVERSLRNEFQIVQVANEKEGGRKELMMVGKGVDSVEVKEIFSEISMSRFSGPVLNTLEF